MTRGFSFTPHRSFIFISLILTIIVGLSGCGGTSTTETPRPALCTPESPNVNIYRKSLQTQSYSIFQHATTPTPPNITPQGQQILEARYAALKYLTYETERWSDTETIKLDETSEAQIVITFLSPELIQAIFVNEFLEHSPDYYDFENKTQAALNSIAARDELLFYVTITTTNNDAPYAAVHMIDIPVYEIIMTNAEDLKVHPSHDDHILDQPINSSSKPVFGILAYPLAMMHENKCNWILDSKFNTSIVLSVSDIKVNGVSSNHPYTWIIEYLPLITADLPPVTPEFTIPLDFSLHQLTPLSNPPKPLSSPDAVSQDSYWQELARFTWNQITLGNY